MTAQRSSTLVVADEETPSTTHGVERFDSRWFSSAQSSSVFFTVSQTHRSTTQPHRERSSTRCTAPPVVFLPTGNNFLPLIRNTLILTL